MATVGARSCSAHDVRTRRLDRFRFRVKRAPHVRLDDRRSRRSSATGVRVKPTQRVAVTARATLDGSGSQRKDHRVGFVLVTHTSYCFGTPSHLARRTSHLPGNNAAGDASTRALDASSTAASSSSSLPNSLPAWRRNASVGCVMLAVFLHLLGFTVTGPITPSLVAHFGLQNAQVGYLTSAYPLGMFFALFLWPRLSDKVGRKPVLAASLFGVGCGLVAQSRCIEQGGSLSAFLWLRVASGAFAGASPIVKVRGFPTHHTPPPCLLPCMEYRAYPFQSLIHITREYITSRLFAHTARLKTDPFGVNRTRRTSRTSRPSNSSRSSWRGGKRCVRWRSSRAPRWGGGSSLARNHYPNASGSPGT